MGTRIGAFKTKATQLVIWEGNNGITFTFGKHYKDKRTGEWRKTETLFADELAQIGDMFIRAAKWSEDKTNMERQADGMTRIGDVVSTVINKIQE